MYFLSILINLMLNKKCYFIDLKHLVCSVHYIEDRCILKYHLGPLNSVFGRTLCGRCTHQFLEKMSDSDLLIPLLNVGRKSIIKLLMDHKDILDHEENSFNLLHCQHWLWCSSCGFKRLHGLKERKRGELVNMFTCIYILSNTFVF